MAVSLASPSFFRVPRGMQLNVFLGGPASRGFAALAHRRVAYSGRATVRHVTADLGLPVGGAGSCAAASEPRRDLA